MSTTTVLTTEKPRRWLARRLKRDDDYVPERLKHAARPATKPDRAIQLVFALGLLVPLIIFACVDPAGNVLPMELLDLDRERQLIGASMAEARRALQVRFEKTKSFLLLSKK